MTPDFLFAMLARASDEDLRLARLVLLAGMGEVALVLANMAARFPALAAGLGAVEAGDIGIFALPRLMAGLPARVGAALELLATCATTMRFF